MSSTLLILIIAIVTIPIHIGVAWHFHRRSGSADELKERIRDLSQQFDTKIGEQTRTMDNKLTKTVESQFSQSRKLIKNITEEITEVKETNKDVLNITESLEDLEQVLTNQKRRGALGEEGLNMILENFLPPNAYELQYQFQTVNKRPDAVIKAKDGIIPVDAKFPLSNYQRLMEAESESEKQSAEKKLRNDLKERIDETAAYVMPDEENTLNFALMYIPAEGVYYDLLVNKVGAASANARDMIEYAHEKNVVIVSPTTFTAYLHTILQGLRAFRIEKNAEQIQESIHELRKHLRSYEDYHKGIGKHLNTVVNKYDQASRKLRGIGRDVRRITDGDFDLDGEEVDNPTLDNTG